MKNTATQTDCDKQKKWLRVAETIDAFRVVPRLFLMFFFWAYVWLVLHSWAWYSGLEYGKYDAATMTALTAFPISLVTGLGAMFTSIYKHYQSSGRNWTKYHESREDFNGE